MPLGSLTCPWHVSAPLPHVVIEGTIADAVVLQSDNVLIRQRPLHPQCITARHKVLDTLPPRCPALLRFHHSDEAAPRARTAGALVRRRGVAPLRSQRGAWRARGARGLCGALPRCAAGHAPVKVGRGALVHHVAIADHVQVRHIVVALAEKLRAVGDVRQLPSGAHSGHVACHDRRAPDPLSSRAR